MWLKAFAPANDWFAPYNLGCPPRPLLNNKLGATFTAAGISASPSESKQARQRRPGKEGSPRAGAERRAGASQPAQRAEPSKREQGANRRRSGRGAQQGGRPVPGPQAARSRVSSAHEARQPKTASRTRRGLRKRERCASGRGGVLPGRPAADSAPPVRAALPVGERGPAGHEADVGAHR